MVPNGDLLIHAGDLMYTGYPDEWYPRLKSLGDLEHKNKIIVPGNHDFHIQNYRGVAAAELRKQAGFKLLDDANPIHVVNGLQILAIPFVEGLHGWAYNRNAEWILDWLQNWTTGIKFDVVVSHSPIYKVLDAIHPEAETDALREHCGSLGMNRWFHALNEKPRVWIHGHIHESYGRTTVDGCTFYNVAMCDRLYAQSNAPMVIDIE